MLILFEKVKKQHKSAIFSWLAEPHVQAFWDNSQAHKDDILNFMEGRVKASSYCDGKYEYWIAKINNEAYAMLMTIQEQFPDDIDPIKRDHLSTTGHTYGIDYMIGHKAYYGKGLGAKTLIEFINFFRSVIDKEADTFLIDPASDNTRARHVYIKAGFSDVGEFVMGADCSGAGKPHCLLVKKF